MPDDFLPFRPPPTLQESFARRAGASFREQVLALTRTAPTTQERSRTPRRPSPLTPPRLRA